MHYLAILNQIKIRRETLQVNQETLAQLAGIGLRTLKQLESGKGNPTLATIQKIANALGLEVTLQLKQNKVDP